MKLSLKRFPTENIANLLPPVRKYTYDDSLPAIPYRYFENADEVPFDVGVRDCSLVNAWWLGDAAMLAYSDPDEIEKSCKAAGFKTVEFFSHDCTQCFVAARKEYVFVAFRGTQAPTPGQPWHEVVRNWMTDFDMPLLPGPGAGRTHKGFQNALSDVWQPVETLLKKLRQQVPSRGTWFTGHSLGAGLATLAAVKDSNPAGIYTFGSPRVGNAAFGKWFDSSFGAKAWRFVNNRDIITRVPIGGDKPVGGLKFIDGRGTIGNVEKSTLTFTAPNSLIHLAREHAADHAPLRYQIHIWNQIVKSLGT